MNKKRFHIKTLGCKVNQYESQVIRESFLKKGFDEANSVEKADVCIVNTCTVTSTSDSKSLKSIRSGLGKKGKRVIVTGCMIESSDLDLGKLKGVDFIVKNKDKYHIPDIIDKTRYQRLEAGDLNGITGFLGHSRAFVKIQDGCDNRCSYCKVAIVRGRSRSKPLEDVIAECRALIKKGYREIVLTGICLGAYGRDISEDINLSKLIMELCKIKGDWRLRLSSIEPKDITDDLISMLRSEEKLCKHLHIPFQSGDDEILRRMARPYTASGYTDIVTKLRKAIPDIAISTDIMAGFPGEEEVNFQDTLSFINSIKPMRLHAFGFSKRSGTLAYNYKDTVNSAVKKERVLMLLNIAKTFSIDFRKMFVDKEVKVLVEDKRDRRGFLQGYTDRYIKVCMEGEDNLKGRLIKTLFSDTIPFAAQDNGL